MYQQLLVGLAKWLLIVLNSRWYLSAYSLSIVVSNVATWLSYLKNMHVHTEFSEGSFT